MNFKEPILFENINFDNIYFDKVKETNNKKIIYLKYKNKGKMENFVTQTPTLWVIKKPTKISDNLYDLEIPLVGKRESNVNNFIDFLNNLDKFVINSAKENASKWFNDSNEATYLNSIRESNNSTISKGFIKLKIIKSLDFKTILKKDNKHKISIDDIKENTWVKSIIQIFAIWVKPNNQFGIYFRPIIISFKEPNINKINYNFIKETEEEDLVEEIANSVTSLNKDSDDNNSEESDNKLSDDKSLKNTDETNIFLKPSDIVESQQTDDVTSILKIDTSSFNDSEDSTTSSDNNIFKEQLA